MLYGRWASKFKFAGTKVEQGKKVDKKFRKRIRKADKRKKAATEVERKKASAERYKKGKLSEYDKMKIEDEMLSRDIDAFKESRIRAGAAPRGKHLQSAVQSYIKSHPLTKDGVARTRYLEFRQAKINKLKKKRNRDIV